MSRTRRAKKLPPVPLHDYLRQWHREDMPAWLAQFKKGDPFPREQFFASRVVFYPGSGTDGHAVQVFGSTHSAHCFVYADYGETRQELERQLTRPPRPLWRLPTDAHFVGYDTLARLDLRASDLVPRGWTPHLEPGDIPPHRIKQARGFERVSSAPFGFLEILEREPEVDDTHGAPRLAVLFLGADGIATYDALFCQGLGHRPPFAVLLQDHGFGGNYDRFGKGGLMERIAIRCGVFPPWLLVARNTVPWEGYEAVPGVQGAAGGLQGHVRSLYRRRPHDT